MNRADLIALAQGEIEPVFFSIRNDNVDLDAAISSLENAANHLRSARDIVPPAPEGD